jgi:hypothetical protein
LAEEWCKNNNVPVNPFNIVTALSSLGLLSAETVTRQDYSGGDACTCKKPIATTSTQNLCGNCGKRRKHG